MVWMRGDRGLPRAGELVASESDRAELCGHAALSVAGQAWELRFENLLAPSTVTTERECSFLNTTHRLYCTFLRPGLLQKLLVYMAKSKKGGGTPKGKGPSKSTPHHHRGRPAYSSRTSGTHASNSYDS